MGFSDSLIDDLDILDYLELLNSTTSVAHALGISQSSCSRRYRALSQRFDLGFDRVDGRYHGTRNGDVLASLLDQRLVDFWLGGLLEFATLLPKPFNALRSQRLSLSQTVMCVPLCRWTLQLFAHRDHPLRQVEALSADQLRRYPSPSLPVGMAPQLMLQLQDKGLATAPSAQCDYQWAHWQGAAADGRTLSYGGPHDGLRAGA